MGLFLRTKTASEVVLLQPETCMICSNLVLLKKYGADSSQNHYLFGWNIFCRKHKQSKILQLFSDHPINLGIHTIYSTSHWYSLSDAAL